jgi:hypothetical protein
MKYAHSVELSKFVNPFVASRIFQRYLDLMRNKEMTPDEAMKACAAEINAEMPKFVAKFPDLKAEWDKLTNGRKVSG